MEEELDARQPLLARQSPTHRVHWLALITSACVVTTLLAAASTSRSLVVIETSSEPIERHFATKTAYWDQRWPQQTPTNGFHLVQTQLVTRHGIRYPTLQPIQDLEALLTKLAPYEATLPRWLRGYTLQYNQSVEGELASSGVVEMEKLADRLLAAHGGRERQVVYEPETFALSHTQVQRTKDSATAFVRRYFRNPHDIEYVVRPKHNDTLLRFFDVCDRYQREVKRNTSAIDQQHAFAKSKAMAASLDHLHTALHLNSTANVLTMRDLAAAFSACAFDVALYDIHDQWCSLLTPTMVTTLDYDDDLKAFYQLAGGYAINYEMAAVLLQDIVAVMTTRIKGMSTITGAFRFAHAETTLPLMTLLGYGTKTPLQSTATPHEIQTRGFRTSTLAPFAANLEFRLFVQQENDHEPSYFVQILVNERENVEIPGCGRIFCPLTTLTRDVWRRFLDYNFEQQCE